MADLVDDEAHWSGFRTEKRSRALHFPNRLDSVSSLFIPELRLRTDKGDVVGTHYLIAAAGNLSATDVPLSKRLGSFKGK